MLNALLQLPQDNYEDLREYFKELIKEYRLIHGKPELPSAELSKLADEPVIKLSEAFGFSLMRRISQAIGLKSFRLSILTS